MSEPFVFVDEVQRIFGKDLYKQVLSEEMDLLREKLPGFVYSTENVAMLEGLLSAIKNGDQKAADDATTMITNFLQSQLPPEGSIKISEAALMYLLLLKMAAFLEQISAQIAVRDIMNDVKIRAALKENNNG